MGTSSEVDLDPDALRRVADDLGAAGPALQQLSSHLEPVTGAAAHFGRPDAEGQLAAELIGRCDEVIAALSRAGALVSTLAEELRAGAGLVAAADEDSSCGIRAAKG